MRNRAAFTEELRGLINRYSMENGSDTPDFQLATYLTDCLEAYNRIAVSRERWYGRRTPSDDSTPPPAGP